MSLKVDCEYRVLIFLHFHNQDIKLSIADNMKQLCLMDYPMRKDLQLALHSV